MNKKQQEQLAAFFEEIYESEQAFELIKKKLKTCKQFSGNVLFNHISNGNDTIEIPRMREYLLNKIACNERQLYELFEKIDISRQGFISKDDFIREISPVDEKVQGGKESGRVNSEIQGYFLSLIVEYLQRFRVLEVARKQIYHIMPYHAFESIDTYKTGIIGLEELRQFLKRNDYNVTDLQLILLLHGLRRRCYLQINLQVFCQTMQPLEFGYYEEYSKRIEQQKQQQQLKRQKNEQQIIKRSRISSKKLENNVAKQQRRKRADLQRQLQLQQRIHQQIKENEKNKQKLKRRDLLLDDKNARRNIQTGNSLLDLEKEKYLADRLRSQQLNLIRNQQNEIQNALVRTALKREDELENSRKLRYNIERQAELQRKLEIERELTRKQYQERILREEMWREKELKQRLNQLKDTVYLQQSEGRFDRQRKLCMSKMEQNKRTDDDALFIERVKRQFDLQRIRNLQLVNSLPIYDDVVNSKRVIDLEHELERTRLQMRERQNKNNKFNLSNGKMLEETAEKQHHKYRV